MSTHAHWVFKVFDKYENEKKWESMRLIYSPGSGDDRNARDDRIPILSIEKVDRDPILSIEKVDRDPVLSI